MLGDSASFHTVEQLLEALTRKSERLAVLGACFSSSLRAVTALLSPLCWLLHYKYLNAVVSYANIQSGNEVEGKHT